MESMVANGYLTSAYAGKKVLLTGHTGFKGSWMLSWLHLLGADVRGYALAPEQESDLYYQIGGDALCHSVIADIRDKSRLQQEILRFEPDYIFHFAAQPLVRLSYELPTETFDVNVMGTAHVLDSLRFLKKPCLAILITTDKVYENKEWPYPYRENDRLGGYDPYSASKAAAEIVVSSFRNSFFNPHTYAEHQKAIASARAGNVIGGGDWAKDRIIPDIIRALSQEKPIVVRNPHSVRPWQHVLEPLSGYLLLGAKMQENAVQYADAWNFGPQADDNLTVQQLVDMAIEVWGSGICQVTSDKNQPHEAGLLKLDINKAAQQLGWTPKWSAKQAIQMTIEFYKNTTGNSLQQVINQIQTYGI